MGTFFWLATEATAEAGGFGLNFDILETNIINLAIAIGLLVYLSRNFLGQILAERRQNIATEIQEAEARKREAAGRLAEEQQKLAQAQAEAERIRAEAEKSARAAKEAILAQAQQEMQRLRDTASQDTTSSQERAIAELRQQVATMALNQVESQLMAQLQNNEEAQRQLIDRSISLLGGRS
jgi:F-type H+-transporting ATPase subunit b